MTHMSRCATRISGIAPLLASAALSLGCARLPLTGVLATGEPLRADVRFDSYDYTVKEKVGSVVHTSDGGRKVERVDVLANRRKTASIMYWDVYQGNKNIADEDYFRIGGDIEAANEIVAKRARGVVANRIGWGMVGLGVAAAVTGVALQFALAKPDPMTGEITLFTPTPYIVGGGLIAVSLGSTLAFVGARTARSKHPIDSHEYAGRAQEVQQKYNNRIGVATESEGDPDAEPSKGE